jgi:hypothetical protein
MLTMGLGRQVCMEKLAVSVEEIRSETTAGRAAFVAAPPWARRSRRQSATSPRFVADTMLNGQAKPELG